MRLFIASYRAGKHSDSLLKLIDDTKRVAVISNAKDYKSSEERTIKVEENLDYFRKLGIQPTDIDLRPYFDRGGAQNLLDDFDFVWLAGGNVFLLRRALKYANVDEYLIKRAKNNSIVLGGESAGAMVIGQTLKESEMDDTEDSPLFIPKGYETEVIWEGLQLIDYVPVPHYRAAEYGPEIDKYIQRLDKQHIPYKQMTDDQAILINDSREVFLK